MLLRRNRKFVGTRERLKRIVATFDSREANSDETRARHPQFRAAASGTARYIGRPRPAILWARTRRARLLTKWLGVLEAAIVFGGLAGLVTGMYLLTTS